MLFLGHSVYYILLLMFLSSLFIYFISFAA